MATAGAGTGLLTAAAEAIAAEAGMPPITAALHAGAAARFVPAAVTVAAFVAAERFMVRVRFAQAEPGLMRVVQRRHAPAHRARAMHRLPGQQHRARQLHTHRPHARRLPTAAGAVAVLLVVEDVLRVGADILADMKAETNTSNGIFAG
jgi:hypothetical protein